MYICFACRTDASVSSFFRFLGAKIGVIVECRKKFYVFFMFFY